ncbi:hypothetical protein F4774DRAFT_401581 [Daldinia eschscholtzii]|nr:hypothetical protein F4774DRAFT_401581 [Daldinia eschscholtzii]
MSNLSASNWMLLISKPPMTYGLMQGIVINVLIPNASSSSHDHTILEIGVENIWRDFIINVRTLLAFTEKLYEQSSKEKAY